MIASAATGIVTGFYYGGEVQVDSSIVYGSTNTVNCAAGICNVASTRLDGGAVTGLGSKTSAFVVDESYTGYASTCP